MKKRILSILLAVLMVLSVAPITVLATEDEALDYAQPEVVEQTEEQPAEEITEQVENEVESVFEEAEIISEYLEQKAAPKKAAKMLMSTPPAAGDVCQIGEDDSATGYTSLDEAIAANKNQLKLANIIDITADTAQTVTAAAGLEVGDFFLVSPASYTDNKVKFDTNGLPEGYGETYGITIGAVKGAGDAVVGYKYALTEYVAQNVTTGVGYTSLSSAISGAKAGETVKLLKDLSASAYQITNTNAITLDLNNNKIDFSNVGFYVTGAANLTVKNGTINTTYMAVYATVAANLTFENVTINANAASTYTSEAAAIYMSYDGGGVLYLKNTKIDVKTAGLLSNGNFQGVAIRAYSESAEKPYYVSIDKDSVITSNGEGIFAIGGGTLDVYGKVTASGKVKTGDDDYACASAVSNNGTNAVRDEIINIYPGAELTSTYGLGIYAPAKGVINMTGGKVYGGAIAGIAIKSGKLNVSGGEIKCTGEKVEPVEGYSNGINASGAAIQIEANASYYGNIEVNISGNAKITSANGYSVYEYLASNKTESSVKSLSITGGQFTGLICLSAQLANSATGKGFISAGLYDKKIEGDKVSFIADGYACIANTDEETKADYPWIVTRLEVKTEKATFDEETGKITTGGTEEEPGKVITVDINKDGEESEETADKQAAVESINEMMNNETVGTFTETGINENTNKTEQVVTESGTFDISIVLNALKEEAENGEGTTAAVTGNDEITVNDQKFKETDVDKKIYVELESAKVEIKTDTQEETTKTITINGSTFDVTPKAKITITTEEGTETIIVKIPNEAITAPITFRLPIDKNINAPSTAVWHCKVNNEGKPIDNDGQEITDGNYKQEYLGIFPIQEENGEKFVELSASEFSYFTYENITEIDKTAKVAIRDTEGKYHGFTTLQDAIAAFNAGAGTNDETHVYNAEAIILLDNIELNKNGEPQDTFDFAGKTIELDLNGHRLTGSVENATNVTVSNSDVNNKKTLEAIGVYKNDVSEFVGNDFDTKKTTVDHDTVILSEALRAKEPTPEAVFSAKSGSTGILYNVTTDMKYSIDGGNTWIDINSTSLRLTNLSGGMTIKVVKKGNGITTSDSEAQIINIAKAEKPANIGKADCTTNANNNGKIKGVDSTMEYRKSTDSRWTPINGQTVTDLTNGTYHVRVKADGTTLASEAQIVTISKFTRNSQTIVIGGKKDKDTKTETKEENPETGAPVLSMSTGIVLAGIALVLAKRK